MVLGVRGRFKFLHPQQIPTLLTGGVEEVLSFREGGSGKCSDVGTVEVNTRYGRGYKSFVDSFEQVIAKSADAALRTTARSRRRYSILFGRDSSIRGQDGK